LSFCRAVSKLSRPSQAVGGDGGPTGDSKIRWLSARATRDQRDFHHDFGFFARCERLRLQIGSKIVLIDGSRSAELMIEFGVAVAADATYTVKRIDNDFFEAI
jgi:restriction endonuclease Mrr